MAALEQAIANHVGVSRYELWFEHKTKLRWEEDRLIVGVPNRFYQEWLQKTFLANVSAAASEVFGQVMQVCFVIDPELFRAARQAQAEVLPHAPENTDVCPSTALPASTTVSEKTVVPATGRRAERVPHRRRLSEFVVGPCNRMGHASALSVVEEPGQSANPLVLYGAVGTGKTHLLEGIYVGLKHARPQWRVHLVTAEEFTNRFIPACRSGKLGSFRKYFRECDGLLVDDLHFLASKRATQEEFLHTFDVLFAQGKQLVVSCDCHPKLSEEFTPELVDRLMGGAVWGLQPPDADTRLAILRAKAAGAAPTIPEPILQFVSSQLRGNVRELEGALHSLRHFSRVTGRPLDMDMAREALGELLRHAVRVVRLADVEQAVCRILRLEERALRTQERAWAVSHPRMVAMFLARKHTAASYSDIGRHFGGRNHSTALAAEKKVRQWLQADESLMLGSGRFRVRDVVELIERELQR
ncbi:MAG: chromosomal replication initiator protein DnaA [Gemmataceae bacterium]